ncbi:sporulation protein YunB [Ferdinandcohnia quinoae]|uniref:Sporulation protein YunB n=1 Tax=Fredinandcohnia quinoae TaxID=2918902 RepID=A0AAW5E2R7_9BACI|nr:sporulation protein YunB [Fredinandcohnia sp. SECRCQ15]MCH1625550.1 sporulation protein YunB [Fredinandcohnia sp. SECRCQ15]
MAKYRGRLQRRRTRKGPLPFRYVFLLTFVFFIFSTAAGLWIINKAIEPVLMKYAENETKKVANTVLKNAINQHINEEEIDIRELVYYEKDETGDVKINKYNMQTINRVATKTLGNIEKYIKYVSEGEKDKIDYPDLELETDTETGETGYVFTVPLGEATDNALLGNLGPQIPIRFHMIGFATTEPTRSIDEWGINNGWLNVDVMATVTMQVILPFTTSEVSIKQTIPIISENINGDVPQFYNNGSDASPSFEIPTN